MLSDKEKSYPSIFGENWKKSLIPIQVCGKEYLVPSNISVLRALHFIALESNEYDLSLGKHCWAGSCENCLVSFIDEEMGETKALACQMETEKGLQITSLPYTMKKKEIS